MNRIPRLKHEVVISTSMLKSVTQSKLMALRDPEDNNITVDCYNCIGAEHKLWVCSGQVRILALPFQILQM